MALLNKNELIINAFEDTLLVLGIYIHFSKAFDLINHDLLVNKLNHYGVRGILNYLIRSYLQHRKQNVAQNDALSDA